MDCRHSLWSAFLASHCRARSEGVRRGAARALIGVGRVGNGSPRKFKRCGRSRTGEEAMARAERDWSLIIIGRGGAADGMVRAGICDSSVASASIALSTAGLALVKPRLDSKALTVFFMDDQVQGAAQVEGADTKVAKRRRAAGTARGRAQRLRFIFRYCNCNCNC
jgi:hypothetical protein